MELGIKHRVILYATMGSTLPLNPQAHTYTSIQSDVNESQLNGNSTISG